MILAIESSCDESALALFDPNHGILGQWVQSQLQMHAQYGGVVPALASREHLEALGPMLKVMDQARQNKPIQQIAVTNGPGLAGCLALGIACAKALATAWNLPLVEINHLHGHAFSPFIPLHQENPSQFFDNLDRLLPHLGLIASGGNTILFKLDRDFTISILAQTIDDAAGEALDKGAKLLGMPYPGGALIEKQALTGNPHAITFPRSFPSSSDMRFSFSGLKTSLRYFIEKLPPEELHEKTPDICASYQQAVIDALTKKSLHALESQSFASFGLSGGVANNKALQQSLTQLADSHSLPFFVAKSEHTGDNAAMIAFAAYANAKNLHPSTSLEASFNPSLPLA